MTADSNASEVPVGMLRVMRIIHASLCLGLIVFLIVVLAVRGSGTMAPPPEVPIISYIAVAFAVIQGAASFLLPLLLEVVWRKQAAQSGAPAKTNSFWWIYYQTRMIMRAALLEGAGFFLAIAYLVEGQAFTIAAAVILLGLLLLLRPTRDSVDQWVQVQRDAVSR
jgi:hypothetical protein